MTDMKKRKRLRSTTINSNGSASDQQTFEYYPLDLETGEPYTGDGDKPGVGFTLRKIAPEAWRAMQTARQRRGRGARWNAAGAAAESLNAAAEGARRVWAARASVSAGGGSGVCARRMRSSGARPFTSRRTRNLA